MAGINLHLGDCMDAMAKMPDKAYPIACVDPQYGINASEMTMGSGTNKKFVKGKKWDIEPPKKEYWNELFRVSVNQIVCGGNYFHLPISRGWIFWDKGINGDVSFADGELIWTSFDTVLRKANIRYKGFLGMDTQRIHITQKPVALYKWILKNYAKPGDKILDTHGGSMSIAIACYEMGFDLDLWEIDPDYYSAGVRRFEDHCRQGKLFSPGEMYLESGKYV
jgi:site-specific DNA-methyltransferase (adenine-specific)